MSTTSRLITITLVCYAVAILSGSNSATAQSGTPFALPPPVDAAEAYRISWYDYDAGLPLNATLKPLDEKRTSVRYRLDYDSVHDQRVPAIVAIPKRFSPPYPAVLLVHGSGGSKDTSYIHAISDVLTAQGYATISIDTQYHGDRKRPGRSGEIHMPDSYAMRDAWVQTVIDLRRAADYLDERQDIDHTRIGYVGFSQGGMLGSVLGGVEPRISAFCLAVPGGGLADIVKHLDDYPVLKAHWPVDITPAVMKTVEKVTNITDPIYYVGRISPRPLLILVANEDEIIPPTASAALIKAAHALPEQVRHVESGHVLNPNELFPIRDFFVRCFGKRTPRQTAHK